MKTFESRQPSSPQPRIIKRIPITDGEASWKKKEAEGVWQESKVYDKGSGVRHPATLVSTGTSIVKPSTLWERRRESLGTRGGGTLAESSTPDSRDRVTGMYSPTLRSLPNRHRSVTFDDPPRLNTSLRTSPSLKDKSSDRRSTYPSPTSPDIPSQRPRAPSYPAPIYSKPPSITTRRTPSPASDTTQVPSLPPTPPKSPSTPTPPSSTRSRSRSRQSSLTPSTPRERLFTLLQESNYVPIDVPGTGNCLFSALADQAWGDKDRHREMRSKIADEIERNRDKYEAEVVVSEMEKVDRLDLDVEEGGDGGGMDMFEKYLERIRTDGKVGDAICIAAYATIFKSDVIVHIVDDRTGELGSFPIEYGGEDHKGLETHIGWYRSDCGIETANHYISVFTPQ
ncbi:hypothetical protein HDV00_004447 [Rhizophlyctis rosea]|nr:hypothetical protein HDV00_004447 [Rhizophlyctis rosea]